MHFRLTHNKRPFNEISQQEADPGDRSNVSQSKRFCVISPDAQWQCHVVDTTNLRPSSRFLEDNSPQSNKESQVYENTFILLFRQNKRLFVNCCL